MDVLLSLAYVAHVGPKPPTLAVQSLCSRHVVAFALLTTDGGTVAAGVGAGVGEAASHVHGPVPAPQCATAHVLHGAVSGLLPAASAGHTLWPL